jgi:hypothetical protein
MNSVEALDVAIQLIAFRRKVRQDHLARPGHDAISRRRSQEHIAKYSAALETLEALRDLIAERAEAQS